MEEIIERPVREAAFHAEGEWAIPEGYEAEIKDGKIIVRKKESEGEVVRKAIMSALEKARDAHSLVGIELERAGVTYPQVFAWLEKQKGRKPAEWSEEDEKMIDKIVENLTELKERYGTSYGGVGDCIAWLEARRPRAKQEQPAEEE